MFAIIDSVFCIVIKIINTPCTSTPKRDVYAAVSGMHKGDQNRRAETMHVQANRDCNFVLVLICFFFSCTVFYIVRCRPTNQKSNVPYFQKLVNKFQTDFLYKHGDNLKHCVILKCLRERTKYWLLLSVKHVCECCDLLHSLTEIFCRKSGYRPFCIVVSDLPGFH